MSDDSRFDGWRGISFFCFFFASVYMTNEG